MKTIIFLLLYLVPLTSIRVQLPDAAKIMSNCRELTITGSLSATLHLSITEKNGSERNRTISMISRSYPDGLEKRLIRFMAPADVRGTVMLVIDKKDEADEMWIYLPALKRTRRIVTSEKGKSFMSSEFSNADMTSPTLSDFTYRHLAGSGSNNQWIIESTPVSEDIADEYGFSRRVSYINSENLQIEKMEFYNFDNELFKTIVIRSNYPLPGGKYLIKDMVADNLISGRKSEIQFSNIDTKVKPGDALFSVQNLER